MGGLEGSQTFLRHTLYSVGAFKGFLLHPLPLLSAIVVDDEDGDGYRNHQGSDGETQRPTCVGGKTRPVGNENEESQRQGAQHSTHGDRTCRGEPSGEVLVCLLHADFAERAVLEGTGIRECGYVVVVANEVVGGDTEEFAEGKDAVEFGSALCSLPLGDGLAADANSLG